MACGISNESEALRSITVGLIAAQVAEGSGVTNREALEVTRLTVGKYARLPLTDWNIQEIALQALFEARSRQATRDAEVRPDLALRA